MEMGVKLFTYLIKRQTDGSSSAPLILQCYAVSLWVQNLMPYAL